MAVELYTSSFICVFLLVIFIPVRRVRSCVPYLAILLWLAGINLIRGINALVWDGNVDIRVPVWCDIATKFMLGSNVALPAIFLCISSKLELLGSSRTFSTDGKAFQNRRLLDLFLCYVLPVIYVGLHPVSQDHRFDLAKDYGCSPSIHNSLPTLALIWIPPLVLCAITFAFSCYAIHHSSRVSYPQFVLHLESRLGSTSSIFFRQLSTSFVMTTVLIVSIALSIFATPAWIPWSSWGAVHSQLWKINIVTDAEGLNAKRFQWWLFFAVSVLYIFLLFTVGEESRDAFRWVVQQLRKDRQLPKLRGLQLPLFHSRTRGKSASGSISNLVAKYPAPPPLTLELKSGWDDMLDTKTSRWNFFPRKTTPSPSQSPPPSKRSSHMDEDKAFMASTLSYLDSPAAKSLGISSPPNVPYFPSPSPQPPTITQPPQLVLEIPPVPRSPPPLLVPTNTPAGSPIRTKPDRADVPPGNIPSIVTSPLPRVPGPTVSWPKRKPVRTDVPPEGIEVPSVPVASKKLVPTDVPPEDMSCVSSVLGAPWPVPPSLQPTHDTSPLTPTPKTRARSASRSCSPTSSDGGRHGFSVVTPANRQLPPIGAVSNPAAFDSAPASKKPLKSALKRPGGKEHAGARSGQLQVVQETA